VGIIPALLYVILSAIAPHLNDRSPIPEPAPLVAPCDPGFGFPEESSTCPDQHPLLGRVTAYDKGTVTVQPIRVWVTGPEGQAYAEAHGLEYPFSNDYVQVDVGEPVTATVGSETVCTGSILVGYWEPLADHLVPCAAFGERVSVRAGSVPAALWFDGDRLAQLSELYRP
jgi:hypothetical protein